MREQCLPLVVDACFSIVESARADAAMAPLAASCLEVIPRYTAWIGANRTRGSREPLKRPRQLRLRTAAGASLLV